MRSTRERCAGGFSEMYVQMVEQRTSERSRLPMIQVMTRRSITPILSIPIFEQEVFG